MAGLLSLRGILSLHHPSEEVLVAPSITLNLIGLGFISQKKRLYRLFYLIIAVLRLVKCIFMEMNNLST